MLFHFFLYVISFFFFFFFFKNQVAAGPNKGIVLRLPEEEEFIEYHKTLALRHSLWIQMIFNSRPRWFFWGYPHKTTKSQNILWGFSAFSACTSFELMRNGWRLCLNCGRCSFEYSCSRLDEYDADNIALS
jgi:hypothetical protein